MLIALSHSYSTEYYADNKCWIYYSMLNSENKTYD